jgi:hypothetical protein
MAADQGWKPAAYEGSFGQRDLRKNSAATGAARRTQSDAAKLQKFAMHLRALRRFGPKIGKATPKNAQAGCCRPAHFTPRNW